MKARGWLARQGQSASVSSCRSSQIGAGGMGEVYRPRDQKSVQGGTRPQWGSSGRELFYQWLDNKVMAVDLKFGPDTVEVSEPLTLFAIPPESFFEVAPDGKRFLVSMPDPTPHLLNVIVNWPALLKSKATGQ
jgi:hypothetical protein